MNYKKRTFAPRLVALGMLVCLLLCTLSGCGKAAEVTLTAKTISNSDATENGCALDTDLLNDIAKTLASAYSSSFDTREMLVAAYRGYNMLATGFDDTVVDPSVVKEPNMEAVRQLIDQATDKLKVEDRVLVGKDYSAMTPADVKVVISALQQTAQLDADKGAIDTLLGWIGTFLGWIGEFTNSYLVALLIFAVIVELLLLPLGIRQQKNSIRQAKLRPKEMAIRKKYAGRDDQVTRQKVSQEIQELYQKENFNPASGCFPLLLQLPIIMALYRIVIDPLQYVLGQSAALSSALELFRTTARAAGGMGETTAASGGTIGLLSKLGENGGTLLEGLKDFLLFDNAEAVYERMSGLTIPDFSLFGLNLGLTPSLKGNYVLLVIPVLTFVVYFFTMKLTKKFTYQGTMAEQTDPQTACSNKIMDLMMPAMSAYFCFIMPALVGIYWIFKSLISTLRQFIVCKIMPYPQFTEEDYKAAEREMAGKAPKKGATTQRGAYSYPASTKTVDGRPKSLFHMDDDEYIAKVEAQERADEQEAEQKAQENAAAKAEYAEKLKDDIRPGKKGDNNQKK